MLDVGWSELLVIAIVMIVVVGPKDLPKMLRAFGKATARMRATANEFRNQFNEALKEAELEDVKNIIDETRKLNPRSKLTQVFDPIRSAGEDLKSSIKSSTSMSPAKSAAVGEVTTPVDASGALVAPSETSVQAEAAPAKPAAAAKKPRKTAVKTPAAKTAAASPPVADKAPAVKRAAPRKAVEAVKPVADKAPTAARKTAAKKTTSKTGTKA